MKIQYQVLAMAIALSLSGTLLAQTPQSPAEKELKAQELREAHRALAEASQRVAELSGGMAGNEMSMRIFSTLGNPDRAIIGLILGESRQDGVRIDGVSPGGPAEKAGLRAGDTIVSVHGTSVAGDNPVLALREALKSLKVGDKVALTYKRDGQTLSSQVVTQAQGSVANFGGRRVFTIHSDDAEQLAPMGADIEERVERIVTRAMGSAGPKINIMTLASMSGLRLTSMNKGLGHYFGIDTGALVLEVDSHDYRGLQAGDVILEVDGKAVNDPRDTLRELGNFEPNTMVEVKLQRDRIPQLVKITVPEKSRAFLAPPAPPAPPLPPGSPSAKLAPRAMFMPQMPPTPMTAPTPVARPVAPLPPLPPAAPTREAQTLVLI